MGVRLISDFISRYSFNSFSEGRSNGIPLKYRLKMAAFRTSEIDIYEWLMVSLD